MTSELTTLIAPAEWEKLGPAGLENKVCVVFDVLRATSTMMMALENGAAEIRPVGTVAEALSIRAARPDCLLAGERGGLRIRAALTGGVDFDLGNSPREFVAASVHGRVIAMTTTNGTRALAACSGAKGTLIASFLNLNATAQYLMRLDPQELVLICGGTEESPAYEDILCAGALAAALGVSRERGHAVDDSTMLATRLYETEQADLCAAIGRSSNGRRLLQNPELRPDVAFCAQLNKLSRVAGVTRDGVVAGL